MDSKEKQHGRAVSASQDTELRIVTTEWVLAEFGDAYCRPADRADFIAFYHALTKNPRARIIPADTALSQRGLELFEKRQDKCWSLTDCLSFVCMREEGLTEALTGDKHFEQAGFAVLLK